MAQSPYAAPVAPAPPVVEGPRPHFRVLGVPVRVQASFFVIALLLGYSRGDGATAIASWLGVVFVSVLLHELGHAMAGRAFGLEPRIELAGGGGLTTWPLGKDVGPGRSLVISLAGPAVGLAVGALVFAASLAGVGRANPAVEALVGTVLWVNVGWSIFNLAPIMPLDGGNALRHFLAWIGLRDADVAARVVSLILGGLLLVPALLSGSLWIAILLGSFAATNFSVLRRLLAARGDQRVVDELRSAYPVWLARGDAPAMIAAGTRARAAAKTDYLRAYATEIVAMGQSLEGDHGSALATLRAMPAGLTAGVPVTVTILARAGRWDEVDAIARQVEATGDPALRAEFEGALYHAGVARPPRG
jgi:Zn-dependent protease